MQRGAQRPLWRRVCHLLVGAREGDDAGNKRKILFLSWQYIGIVTLVAGNINGAFRIPASVRFVSVTLFICTALLLGIAPTLIAKDFSRRRASVLMSIMTLCLILSDWWHAAQHRFRVWPFALLIVNLWQLLGDQQLLLPAIAVGVVALWILLERVEASAHFGLAQMADFTSDTEVDLCACASPPCSVPLEAALFDSVLGGVVLITDFFLTRVFVDEVHNKEVVVQSAVMLVQRISVLLARYKTEEAAALVVAKDSAVLPSDLREALQQISINLQHYKPYLPDMVLSAAGNGETTTFLTTQSMASASTLSSGTSDGELRIAPGQNPLQPAFTVLPADPDGSAGQSSPTPRRRPWRKRSRSLKVLASSARITLPQLKKRYLTLQCARLQGLRESCLNMSTSAVSHAVGNFLAGALAACRKCGGMQHSFDDGVFIATFGMQMQHYTNSCVEACRCALVIRGVGDIGSTGASPIFNDSSSKVLQSVHWGLVLAGEVGTSDSRGISIMGDALARITRLCDHNEEAGALVITTEALWGRVQHETWLAVRELGISDSDEGLLELVPGAGVNDAVIPYISGVIALTAPRRAAADSVAAAAVAISLLAACSTCSHSCSCSPMSQFSDRRVTSPVSNMSP